MKQYVLAVDNIRGHMRFTLFEALSTGDVAGTSDTTKFQQVSSDNSPFTASGLTEPNNSTFTLTAQEP